MAATDDYAGYLVPPPGPCRNTAAVVPSDAAALTDVTRALYVGGAGDVTLVDQAGNTTLFKAVPLGTVLPVACSQVKATGTTATNLVALW